MNPSIWTPKSLKGKHHVNGTIMIIYEKCYKQRICETFKQKLLLLSKLKSSVIIRTCAYQGVRKVRFSENLTCFGFLKHPFWDSPFCLITDEVMCLGERKKKKLPNNKTNHSLTKWEQKQLQHAQQTFGYLKELKFCFISLEILQNQNKNVQLSKQSDALKRWK